MATPPIPLNPSLEDPHLMERIVQAAPNSPGNVEKANNPNSILNRVHPDRTVHPISQRFTRKPNNSKVP